MATAKAQRRWRERKRYVKSQLNVMAGRLVHNDLAEIAKSIILKERGEAVGFASCIAKGLIQYSTHNLEAKRLPVIFVASYERDRDLYS